MNHFKDDAGNAPPGPKRREFLAGLAGAAGAVLAGTVFLQGTSVRTRAASAGRSPGAGNDGLHAGAAKIEITPDGDSFDLSNNPIKAGEPLYARVLVLREGGLTVAVVSLDLILFSSRAVIERATAEFGVDHVILCSTHTHAAPAPEALRIKPPLGDWTRLPHDPGEAINWDALSDDPWYAATEDKIVEAIGEAVGQLRPARVTAGSAPFESAYMAHNRRKVHPDGRVTMMWDNPYRLATEPIDPTVGFIRVDSLDGDPISFVVHYACHPVSTMGGGIISRDFPGATVDHIEEQLGGDCVAMMLQGASGDIDPYDTNLTGEHARNVTRNCGISLAEGALKAAAAASDSSGNGSLRIAEDLLTIDNRDSRGTTDVLVTTLLINGDTALVAVPGEPFIEHQLELRRQADIPNAFLTGIAYSGQGSPFVIYIPTEQAAAEGGYGANECTFLTPSAGKTIVETAVRSIANLKPN